MVSVCLPSDALLQHLPSYLGFSYLGRGVSLHSCSSKAQPLLLTLDEGYLLTTTLPDLQRGMAPLGPPAPAQPPLLEPGVAPPSHRPWPRHHCRAQTPGSSSPSSPLTSDMGPLLIKYLNRVFELALSLWVKHGKALYIHQKEDWEWTVAQIMNSSLPNSDLN